MMLRRLPLILMAMTLCIGICRAQNADSTGFLLEFGASYGFGAQFASIPVYAGNPECGEFTSGASQSLGLGSRYIAPSFFSPRLGLFAGVAFSTHSGALVAQAQDPLLIPTNDGIGFDQVGHEYRYNITSQAIQLEFGVRYPLLDILTVQGGLSVGYRNSGRLWQIDTITGGGRVFLPEGNGDVGTRERPMLEGENLSLNPVALGIIAGASVKLPVGHKIWISPGLFAKADILSLSSGADWRAVTAGASLSILFHVPSGDDPDASTVPPLAVTPPPAATPVLGTLNASVDLYGTDENERRLPAATIRVYETFRRTRIGRIDAVRFVRNSQALTERYAELMPRTVPQFRADSLAAAAPVQLRRHTLNIIGERLRHDPAAAIRLSGATLRGESSRLATARAQAVRSYLTDIWGIDNSRITLGEPGKGESAVSLAATKPSILDPVLVERIEPMFDPPLIMLDPVIQADAGVKRWEIELSHDGRVIGRYGSRDSAAGDEFRLDWTIVGDNPQRNRSTLMAELVVEDSLGRTISSRSQTPLEIERTARIVDRWEKDGGKSEEMFFTLYPFPPGSAVVQGRNSEVVAEIAASAGSGARVRVIETGEGELAARRSQAVAAALRAALGNRAKSLTVVKQQDVSVSEDVRPLLELAGARGVRVLVERDLLPDGSQ